MDKTGQAEVGDHGHFIITFLIIPSTIRKRFVAPVLVAAELLKLLRPMRKEACLRIGDLAWVKTHKFMASLDTA